MLGYWRYRIVGDNDKMILRNDLLLQKFGLYTYDKALWIVRKFMNVSIDGIFR